MRATGTADCYSEFLFLKGVTQIGEGKVKSAPTQKTEEVKLVFTLYLFTREQGHGLITRLAKKFVLKVYVFHSRQLSHLSFFECNFSGLCGLSFTFSSS